MKKKFFILLPGLILMSAACGLSRPSIQSGQVETSTAGAGQPAAPSAAFPATAIAPTPTAATLRPADSAEPAAGICASSAASEVAIRVISGNMPEPRCIQVAADQRLQFTNDTSEEVRIQLGKFDATIPAGEVQMFDAPAGSFLAPGVHYATVSGGSIPAIWLVAE
jgi:hypothetical protein